MSALVHRVICVTVVLVAVTLPSLAEGVGVVTGRVTDDGGVPLEGVVVTLSAPGVLGTMRANTNERGRYRFPAVPGNTPLNVRAEALGRVPVEYVGHTARRNGSITIDFALRAPGDHEVLVLLEEGVPYHRLALEGALTTMPGETTQLLVDDIGPATVRALREQLEARPSAVLAIGERAAKLARRNIRDVPIVYSMVPAPLEVDLTTTNMCGVRLNGGFDIQIEHLRHVLPGAQRVGTIYDPHRMGGPFSELKRSAVAADLELVAAHFHGNRESDLRAALAQLKGQDLDAFLLLLDPRVVDAPRFEEIRAFVETEGLVLAVPDASLAITDQSFSFGPGFWDLGAFSGTLVRQILEGESHPSQIGLTYPDREFLSMHRTHQARKTPGEVLPGGSAPVRVAMDD